MFDLNKGTLYNKYIRYIGLINDVHSNNAPSSLENVCTKLKL